MPDERQQIMLPPMAIFFPLFTLLEDFGYLPRVAFNLDRMFQKVGAHGKQATRGVPAEGMKDHPILKGCEDIFGPTDVYTTNALQGDAKPLVMGQVLEGMKPTDKPIDGPKNNPMMPVAWTKSYTGSSGKTSRVFCTTMGASQDLLTEGTRRMIVNAAYWCLGFEDKIPAKNPVEIVGSWAPTKFGFNGYKKGVKPADLK
jgi:hypothetical protein